MLEQPGTRRCSDYVPGRIASLPPQNETSDYRLQDNSGFAPKQTGIIKSNEKQVLQYHHYPSLIPVSPQTRRNTYFKWIPGREQQNANGANQGTSASSQIYTWRCCGTFLPPYRHLQSVGREAFFVAERQICSCLLHPWAVCKAELYVECNSGIKADKAGSLQLVASPVRLPGQETRGSRLPGLIGAWLQASGEPMSFNTNFHFFSTDCVFFPSLLCVSSLLCVPSLLCVFFPPPPPRSVLLRFTYTSSIIHPPHPLTTAALPSSFSTGGHSVQRSWWLPLVTIVTSTGGFFFSKWINTQIIKTADASLEVETGALLNRGHYLIKKSSKGKHDRFYFLKPSSTLIEVVSWIIEKASSSTHVIVSLLIFMCDLLLFFSPNKHFWLHADNQLTHFVEIPRSTCFSMVAAASPGWNRPPPHAVIHVCWWDLLILTLFLLFPFILHNST